MKSTDSEVAASRPESVILGDLKKLCGSPGYVHVIAAFCFRDAYVGYSGELKKADVERMFSFDRLIRTEIDTLLGFLLKHEIEWSMPTAAELVRLMGQTEQLLSELHECLNACYRVAFEQAMKDPNRDQIPGPMVTGEVWREPIFYSGESAYDFQYLDLAVRKYSNDAAWLQENKGFSIEDAATVAAAIEKIVQYRVNHEEDKARKLQGAQRDCLSMFAFKAEEVAEVTGLDPQRVRSVLSAFSPTADERNHVFEALHDENVASWAPLLCHPNGHYFSMQPYALAEAVYESPFYWMLKDDAYRHVSQKHRGAFTESFVAERLAKVFDPSKVYLNVDVFESKSRKVSEIDVLVFWGDRAVVIQTKSKRLTAEARRGNDLVLKADFQKAVQSAYDQASECANCLLNSEYRLALPTGNEVARPISIAEVYLLCVLSDNYPALSFQARQFLETKETDRIRPPLVTDVFCVDAMTEMLSTPLQFLSYVNRRARYSDRLLTSQENTILAYHLSRNLWVDSEITMLQIADDFAADLDIAMTVRRRGIPGEDTPKGRLTRLQASTLGTLIRNIEANERPETIDLGFLLLTIGEDAANQLSRAIERQCAVARADGRKHDVTFLFQNEGGLTLHFTGGPLDSAQSVLMAYCERRKYKERQAKWFGVIVDPSSMEIRFALKLSSAWRHDSQMESDVKNMKGGTPASGLGTLMRRKVNRIPKVARNEPCPCGSGRKYKKCCLLRF